MLTPKMYATEIETPYQTVMSWLQRDLVEGAERQEMPDGSVRYLVPAGAPKPELKRGPKPKKEVATKPAKKSRKKGEQ